MKALKTSMLALHFLESTMPSNGSLQDLSPLETWSPETGGSWGLSLAWPP